MSGLTDEELLGITPTAERGLSDEELFSVAEKPQTREQRIAAIPGEDRLAAKAQAAKGEAGLDEHYPAAEDTALKKKRTWGDRAIGAIETAGAVAGSLIGGLTSTPAALLRKATGSKESLPELAAQESEKVQQTFGPKSETGKEYTGNVTKAFDDSKIAGLPTDMNLVAPRPTQSVLQAGRQTLKNDLSLGGVTRSAAKSAERQAVAMTKMDDAAIARDMTERGYKVAPEDLALKAGGETGLLTHEISTVANKSALISKAAKENLRKAEIDLKSDFGMKLDEPWRKAKLSAMLRETNAPYEQIERLTDPFTTAKSSEYESRLKDLAGDYAATAQEFPKSMGLPDVSELTKELSVPSITPKDAINLSRRFRDKAQTYSDSAARSGDPNSQEMSRVYRRAADVVEGLIQDNLVGTDMYDAFAQARKTKAKVHTVMDILHGNELDIQRLGKLVDKGGAPFEGVMKRVGEYAALYPDYFASTQKIKDKLTGANQMKGSSFTGILGELLGVQPLARKVLMSEGRRKAAIPPAPKQDPFAVQKPAPGTSVVPYVSEGEVQPTTSPNWTMGGKPGIEPDVQPVPPNTRNALGVDYNAGRYSPTSKDRNGRIAGLVSKTKDEAQAAAESATPRASTSGGQLYELDPITGKLKAVDEGLKGATPHVIQSTGHDLSSAAEKISSGRRFAMSAEEKIAWNQTKVDLYRSVPELKGLSDEAVAAKIADRKWVNDALTAQRRAVENAAVKEYASFAKKAAEKYADNQSKAKAIAQYKESKTLKDMRDSLATLEDLDIAPKLKAKLGQGPKTRAAQTEQFAMGDVP